MSDESSSSGGPGGDGDMTLAFELSALQALADPNAVFNDARQWTEYVGVLSDKPTYVVTNFTRKHRIRQDFFSGPRGVQDSLENVKRQFDTERHVFVGTTEEDEAIAEAAGWEYLPLEGAAEAAGWAVAGGTDSEDHFASSGRDDWP
ncbi:DUF7124 domain-containing protein [Halobellus salinisoli]|uniref:DUF7124 domain-containing protein n=1 Tax=Halobellus salinisoli TaxID=3108500 RepID=UPI00300BE552